MPYLVISFEMLLLRGHVLSSLVCLLIFSLWVFIAILYIAMEQKVDYNLFQYMEHRLQAGD